MLGSPHDLSEIVRWAPDSIGTGVQAVATSGGGRQTTIGFPPAFSLPLSPPMQPPLQIYHNLLPVSRGTTVANEVLGGGDATVAGQATESSSLCANGDAAYRSVTTSI
jgi:hypothetical protein